MLKLTMLLLSPLCPWCISQLRDLFCLTDHLALTSTLAPSYLPQLQHLPPLTAPLDFWPSPPHAPLTPLSPFPLLVFSVIVICIIYSMSFWDYCKWPKSWLWWLSCSPWFFSGIEQSIWWHHSPADQAGEKGQRWRQKDQEQVKGNQVCDLIVIVIAWMFTSITTHNKMMYQY